MRVAPNRQARLGASSPSKGCCACLALVGSTVCAAGVAQDAPAGVISLMAVRSHMAEPAVASFTAERRPGAELAGIGYRWSASHGRADLSVGVGTLGRPVSLAGASSATPTLAGAGPLVVLGWRYRVSEVSAVYADASRAALSGAADEPAQYAAKLGVEWRARKVQGLGVEPGSLGVQFDSGYRMSLRLRSGGVKLLVRSQF